ncbi:DNA polymerase III subunit beta [Halorubrum ezzemoulense]|uniref:DNA polymerase III subunit beta n=1 Tax=Halorubrum ezzemoulense TaxID=337243 RepID=A0A238YD35_HALEZ|nr:nucleotidyltransferase domain-containing protein [Halorubrum ezzemoulense]MDB2225913.1 nucleotidyltransferase domain-containing protein [Halorubrum ezzemoulense]MDB2239274.1 nucleotidyltransferase domain-containing protein [Halorubrum ezzemoulense]MDB2248565.1 nucleotidyltransferase domain-containing protein [Halorubrum ezzemoulense]MDB2272451.1 nucleotidyltransferase domain-containing protein [Halorubrum ezzemoulense]MDB2276141.1 nucleotidyltransferase domain-containing protein [Halorubrum
MVESNHDGSATDGVDVAALRRYLATTDVRFAVLFGSRVRGETHDSSDVDVVLRFPEELSPKERFRRRNRIDTDLQGYADDFVDVSDIEDLPLPIARAALREGVRLVGDERELTAYREQIDAEYERTAADREWDRREFIDRLARGDI